MAEETVNLAIKTKKLPFKACKTKHLKIHGYQENPDRDNHLYIYGSDQNEIIELQKSNPDYAKKLHQNLDFTAAEVIWAVQKEMACTVDDVLSRRVRALIMNAKVSIEMAPTVASIMAKELQKDKIWEEKQVREFSELAKNYFIA
jgi:glycerol-3-phosphate dehydrogenase